MIIYLLNNHEAALVDDRADCVTVIPPTDGVLSVEGDARRINREGDTPSPTFSRGDGAVNATFTTSAGIRYRVLSPRMVKGIPVSRVDPFNGYIAARLYIRALEEKLDDTIQELRDLKGSIQHDSLGFIITNKEE